MSHITAMDIVDLAKSRRETNDPLSGEFGLAKPEKAKKTEKSSTRSRYIYI